MEADYFEVLDKAAGDSGKRKVVMFPGANIGNMPADDALLFIKRLRRYLEPGDLVLMGFDLKKHPKLISAAYNDKAGITALFNLNLLERINRELHADFCIPAFEHYQHYDPDSGACKSYLVSLREQLVTIDGQQFSFNRDETIFMEISQKYTLEEISLMAHAAGFHPLQMITDSNQWFADVFWSVV